MQLDGSEVPIELYARRSTSRIIIGDDVHIRGGASLEAEDSIVIGDRVVLGAYVKILDNHLHPLRGNRRLVPPSAPVQLDSDVVVCDRAIVLPGTHLMSAARVCEAAVVSRRVPPHAVVSGIPARASKRSKP